MGTDSHRGRSESDYSVVVVLEEVLIAASTVATSLVGRAIHSIRVIRASASVDEDAREQEAVFMNVELEPPANSEETWPREDIDELRRSVEAELEALGIDLPVYVRPLTADDAEDVADEEEIE
jgi:hypothetical protein